MQVEDVFAVLDRNNTTRRKTLAVTNAIYFVQNWNARVASAQKVCVQGMHVSAWFVNRARCGNKGLTRYLSTKCALTVFVR
jgi:hypothetical protein